MATKKAGKASKSKPGARKSKGTRKSEARKGRGKGRDSAPAEQSQGDQCCGPSVNYPWDLCGMGDPDFNTTKILLCLLGEMRYQTLFAEPFWSVLDHCKSRLRDCIGAFSRTTSGGASLPAESDIRRAVDRLATAMDDLCRGLYGDTTLLDLFSTESRDWSRLGRDIKIKAERLERAGVAMPLLGVPDQLMVRFKIRHLFADGVLGKEFLRYLGTMTVKDYFTKPLSDFASSRGEQEHIKALIMDASDLGCLKCYPRSRAQATSLGVISRLGGTGYCCDSQGNCVQGPPFSWCFPADGGGCAVGSDVC